MMRTFPYLCILLQSEEAVLAELLEKAKVESDQPQQPDLSDTAAHRSTEQPSVQTL